MSRRSWLLLVLLVAGGGAAWFALAWIEREYYPADTNYSFVEPQLYIGGVLGDAPPGIGAVLNLCEHDDAYGCAVHRWEPIRDAAPAPDLDWLRRQVEFIDAQRREGRTVFVHCRNGVSRSGMVVVAYLMFEHDWTRDEALAFARSKRPVVRPNPAFMERLGEWQADLAQAGRQ